MTPANRIAQYLIQSLNKEPRFFSIGPMTYDVELAHMLIKSKVIKAVKENLPVASYLKYVGFDSNEGIAGGFKLHFNHEDFHSMTAHEAAVPGLLIKSVKLGPVLIEGNLRIAKLSELNTDNMKVFVIGPEYEAMILHGTDEYKAALRDHKNTLNIMQHHIEAKLTHQNVLFHATSMYAALQIITSGKFNLTSDLGVASEQSRRVGTKRFYLSCARSRYGRYGLAFTSSGYASITLDRAAIAHHHTIKPIDYWENTFKTPGQNTPDLEQEDRVYSDKPNLETKGLLLAVNIIINLKTAYVTDWVLLRKLLIVCGRNKIPMHVYSDKQAFLAEDTKRSIPLHEMLDKIKHGPQEPRQTYAPVDYASSWRELYYKKDAKELSKRGINAMKMLRHSYDSYDAKSSFDADMHSARSNLSAITKLDRMFKDSGFTTVAQMLKYLTDKWAPLYDKYYKEIAAKEQKSYENSKRQITPLS